MHKLSYYFFGVVVFHSFSVVFMLIGLTGCAFEPLYQEYDENCLENKVCPYDIDIKVVANGYNSLKLQKMLNAKKHLVQGKLKSKTTLSIKIAEEFGAIGISSDESVTRGQGRISVDLVLTIDQDGMTHVKNAHFDQVSSYELDDGDTFTFDRAQSSVRERLLKVLSEQIIRETLYLLD